MNKIKMMKEYSKPDEPITYESVDEKDVLYLIRAVRTGIGYPRFAALAKAFPFSINDWSGFLHLSERTIQRYQKEVKAFDPVSSERIIEITLLYKHAVEVFGSKKKLDVWLDIQNVALGGAKPKELLDSTFGLQLIRNELVRIEHGVLS
ncbi:MAG: MbcA/ParS/Xre antitoxin family protein [Bacteroidia bacterium]|nr:MbcA/ParS/Xre antitoxin family protein [Bacteroidia bacterium]